MLVNLFSDSPDSEGTTGNLTVDAECAVASPDAHKSCPIRKGSSGIVGNMMLLHSFQKMHAPYTQVSHLLSSLLVMLMATSCLMTLIF